MLRIILLLTILLAVTCTPASQSKESSTVDLMVLGVAQDAGYPQAGCNLNCCTKVWSDPTQARMISSLGLVDHQSQHHWVFDATPDFPQQIKMLEDEFNYELEGVWLTHAHIGHYTGLMYLGHEVMGAESVPVYAMPRMQHYLKNNGPWSQLVSMNNIELKNIEHNQSVVLNPRITVTPLSVPHRDEYSETVGYRIVGPKKKALFIPDINKWNIWERSLVDEIAQVDWVFVDGTFFADGELPNRDMSKIPHPMVSETMDLLADISHNEKAKVYFIHLNHTNPLLSTTSTAYKNVIDAGFNVAQQGQVFNL